MYDSSNYKYECQVDNCLTPDCDDKCAICSCGSWLSDDHKKCTPYNQGAFSNDIKYFPSNCHAGSEIACTEYYNGYFVYSNNSCTKCENGKTSHGGNECFDEIPDYSVYGINNPHLCKGCKKEKYLKTVKDGNGKIINYCVSFNESG